MDAFEGLHSVQLSSSPPLVSATNPGYEVLVSARSGVQVYSNTTFYGKPSVLEQAQKRGRAKYHSHREETKEERCEVGRLVDLEPGPIPRVEGRGQGDPRPTRPQEQGTQARGREGSRLERAAPLEGARGGEHEDNVSRLRSSSLEIREKGSEILREQLDAAQKELKLKDKECERLSQIRDQLEQELEELTASLFEEAHRMVREANVKQAAAEKQLKEAQGKSDVLQAEVSALKTMVLTSTPSSPNRQAHPQLLSPGTRSRGASPQHGGGHTRNKSASGALPLAPGGHSDLPSDLQPVREDKEMDNILYAEFLTWRNRPSLDRSSAFLVRIYREDISPCLSFTRSELSQSVQSAVENNSLTIEPVAMSALPMVKANAIECGGPNGLKAAVETKCALSGISCSCKHQIKLGDEESYYYISPSSRARITAVCNFFTYIRYIQQGLVRHDAEQMFWEMTRLRREMTVAKLGFYLTDQE
ncbi:guanine nucleotide exchange factor for Rab-3A isoform X1 [Salmo salar]|uniref:Guanine nucleotide exchange factor for Rab-3A isoform X1 n=1 Tax=Salmo salar TaxID=8030 RepID=A0ABM3DT19_SALSA|nr:guanine nucleotide exchange factor for Rab-3A isoform X1 [Salmo salar]XP_045561941.1 guanine nucleotide exchange factor for Rab-3A isoform X1 [Salmo salar]XP_045561942.1 guanine nucleotide exchange factor for Rab-3A isoform X1 [Salmo salar]XP_045561943.1 guanine nucleotide exchange factor for Rab-3A isoform X1 [Salmo salar]